MDPALQDWLTLLRAPGVGVTYGGRLLRAFGSPSAALEAERMAWDAAGVPGSLQEGLSDPELRAAVARDLDWLGGSRRTLVTLPDPAYPHRLRQIAAPPLALFCEGEITLLPRPQVAIVGARYATPQGRESAAGFAAELVRAGLVVSSGLARGIDGAAHQGALDAGGPTLAVCGTGLDDVYPPRHRGLAQRIAEHGLLVSEFPTRTAPSAANFPRRNRILSGLSLGVLVVEAALDSGSLVTARLALEQGREVFAVPGSVHSPMSRGPHALLRQGAKLTESVHDIFEEIGVLARAEAKSIENQEPSAPEGDAQRRILDALGHAATPLDKLVERLGMPPELLSPALLALELDGRIATVAGGAYQRVGR